LGHYQDALIFPGKYELSRISDLLPPNTKIHIDVAYDVESVAALNVIRQPIETIILSTSSPLFKSVFRATLSQLAEEFRPLKPVTFILKENRGGSRLYNYSTKETSAAPAQLSETINSVGVGDVFDAIYLRYYTHDRIEALWRAGAAASSYAHTTEPSLLQAYIKRNSLLSIDELRELGGTFMAWEARKAISIYLAAPDFSRADRRAIERAASALNYHNFMVRRPVQENGELPPDSDLLTLANTYRKDVDLLKECQLVFAVPTERDPGTLVEIGLAIEMNIPVVVYDPAGECGNTMVIAGSDCYSTDLDACLNATFAALGKVRSKND
jgi:nucleoside 2-deoxyribosyltransferase